MSGNSGPGAFERIDREAAAVIGHGLFTVTAFDVTTMQVRRIYSSNAAAYPVGGRKAKRDTEFGRKVLVEGQPLVCEGDAEIARVFDDHETIRGLGMHSSLNAPVLDAERCIGVLNFLMAGETVTAAQLQSACSLAREPDVIAALNGDF